jgi:hypothetical protein
LFGNTEQLKKKNGNSDLSLAHLNENKKIGNSDLSFNVLQGAAKRYIKIK